MLLLLSHISPTVYESYYFTVFESHITPTVCESRVTPHFCESCRPTVYESRASPTFVSIALMFVSHILPTTVCESFVKLFL